MTMTEPLRNLLAHLPVAGTLENVDCLATHGALRIERIVSHGHISPAAGWYDQPEQEWVLVLAGAGQLAFEDGEIVTLYPGDFLEIPAHRRHRVSWTTPDAPTVWLAIFSA